MKTQKILIALTVTLLVVAVPGSSVYAAQEKKQTAAERALARLQKKNACKSKCTQKLEKCTRQGETYQMCRFGILDGCFERCENM